MATERMFTNNLAAERERQGIRTADELARRAEIDPSLFAKIEAGEILPSRAEVGRLTEVLGVKLSQLYTHGLIGAIGVREAVIYEVSTDERVFYREYADAKRLTVSREEMTWLERAVEPDGEYDVFVNMSCSTQTYPNLMLDTVAVLRALGVSFAAGAGADFCCGGYAKQLTSEIAGARWAEKSVQMALAGKAHTHVSQCTQCVNNFTARFNRRVADGEEAIPLRAMQLLDFLAERLVALGDDVPWVRSVDRKVVVHGHLGESPITTRTVVDDVARVLRLVPGVEVVGLMEPTFMDDFCYTGDLPGYPTTPEQMQAKRHEIAAIAQSYGADTVSPQHQDCSRIWASFASVEMSVRNAVSIVAEGLGCDHPDRVQAAHMLGDPDAVIEQTRPIWTSWGLTEDKAREIAHREYKLAIPVKVAGCACGRGGCGSEVGTIDVLEGVDWKSAVSSARGIHDR